MVFFNEILLREQIWAMARKFTKGKFGNEFRERTLVVKQVNSHILNDLFYFNIRHYYNFAALAHDHLKQSKYL